MQVTLALSISTVSDAEILAVEKFIHHWLL